MAKTAFTIDPKYYAGRIFDPILTPELVLVQGHPMPVDINVGGDNVVCLKFTLGKGVSVSCVELNPPATTQHWMISLNSAPADFSSGARLSSSIQGAANVSGMMAGAVLPMTEGGTYYVNFANSKVGAEMLKVRIQVSLW